jgi:hypothetical protein
MENTFTTVLQIDGSNYPSSVTQVCLPTQTSALVLYKYTISHARAQA